MFFRVSLPRLFGMVSGMNGVAAGRVSVMGCFFVHPALMVLRRFGVMPGGIRMMFRSFFVVLRCFLRHGISSGRAL